MALTEAKLEYYRQYRAANRDEARAAYKRWYDATKDERRSEYGALSRAIKRKSYYKKMGDYENVEAQQNIINALREIQPPKKGGLVPRLSAEERLARRQATLRKVRYRHIKGVPTFRAPETCEACGCTGKICMDHDHVTHTFRGWLCDDCNLALGRLKEDVGRIKGLLAYLEKLKENLK